MRRRRRLIVAAQVVVLLGASAAAVATSDAGDWRPFPLVMLLLVLAVATDLLTVEARGVRISGAFLSIVLSMALLGPAPAAAIGGASALIDALVSRRSFPSAANNVATWTAFPVIGGLLVEALVGAEAPHREEALAFAAAVLLTFFVTNVRRTRKLASVQVGLLNTVLQTLSMRDAMTARHSAAVARYAREVARKLALPDREQDLIHTAALLHDIGKFIFPDSILFADRRLTEHEWETVKLHPEQGARLVRGIEGYGPVADIVLAHHERVDGNGYPNRLAGDEIPLGSRIISVADTYDVMTSRDSYRRRVSPEAAIVELRRVAGSQLDAHVVEAFVEVMESGRVAFHHDDAEDFEKELAFDRRVEDYARPRIAVA